MYDVCLYFSELKNKTADENVTTVSRRMVKMCYFSRPVWCQYQCTAALSHFWQGVPYLTSGHWVHPSRRLIEKDDRRVAHQCYAGA